MTRLKVVTLISFSLSVLIANYGPDRTFEGKDLPMPKNWLTPIAAPLTPKEHIRPGDQTFLTYPEWYLVHSPREQADFFEKQTSTSFPYFSHILQLWKSYEIMNHQVSGNFEFNGGYHAMIWVIATSTTVEYAIKGFYEKLIGRMTDTDGVRTAEDQFNATYMRDYVKFIMQTPWYEYNYFEQLKTLWNGTTIRGDHQLRKWERRFYLSTEFMIKGAYAWLIRKATKSAYEEPILSTVVVATGGRSTGNGRVKFLKNNSDGSSTLSLPRYADFTPALRELALQGAQIQEVAGNSGTILITILTQAELNPDTGRYRILFTQPIVSEPGQKRLALAVKISRLSDFLRLGEKTFKIEHIYDF